MQELMNQYNHSSINYSFTKPIAIHRYLNDVVLGWSMHFCWFSLPFYPLYKCSKVKEFTNIPSTTVQPECDNCNKTEIIITFPSSFRNSFGGIKSHSYTWNIGSGKSHNWILNLSAACRSPSDFSLFKHTIGFSIADKTSTFSESPQLFC